MLERDEFVIDTERRDKIEREGTQECADIRAEAERTVLRLELLRDRVEASTWAKMAGQQNAAGDGEPSRALKSIQNDTLVFNYPVRKRELAELRKLQMVVHARKMELREKLNRMENSIREAMDEEEFSAFEEQYLMNRVRGMPEFVEDDSIAEAAKEFADKEVEKKLKKEKMEMTLQSQNNPNAVGKKQPILKITKGKLGTKTRRKDDDDDDAANKNKKFVAREIKGMEEMYWKIQSQKKQVDAIKKVLSCKPEEGPPISDLIYEPYELSADGRKVNQIELLKGVVFELKKEFNMKFKKLRDDKETTLGNIAEKNEVIKELLDNLKIEEELFSHTEHPLEEPENILVVNDDEIKVERYLTAAERAEKAEAERKEAERLAKLQGDNVGQRGLKAMMGGTELNLKKDKGGMGDLDALLEDWMNKPEDDMTEEEKVKFKEYKQKEKEFKDKQRKGWEQDLKKAKADIIDMQLKFEEQLLTMFKLKLFYDVRILEQELMVIRLVIMLHDGKETRHDERKYRTEL